MAFHPAGRLALQLANVEHLAHLPHSRHSDIAQRFGLPVWEVRSHPREPNQIAVAFENQVGQGARGQIRRRHALARIASREASPGCAVEPDANAPIARNAKRPPPAVRDRRAFEHREERQQRLVDRVEDRVTGIEAVATLRARVVGSAPAERQPPVHGSLPVDDHAPRIGEALAASEPDLLPGLLRERLGGDHVGVERSELAAATG